MSFEIVHLILYIHDNTNRGTDCPYLLQVVPVGLQLIEPDTRAIWITVPFEMFVKGVRTGFWSAQLQYVSH